MLEFVVSKWGVVLLLRNYEGNALLAQGSDPHSANVRHGLGRSSLLFCPSLNGFVFRRVGTFLSSGPPPAPGAVSPPESSCQAGGWELWGGQWEKRWFLSSRFVTEVSSQNESKRGRQELYAYCLSLICPWACLTLKDKNTAFLLHVFSANSLNSWACSFPLLHSHQQ